MAKLSAAGAMIIHRLLSQPETSIVVDAQDRGYCECPRFSARWLTGFCNECRRPFEGEPVSCKALFALEERGLIKPRWQHVYDAACVTPAGHAAYDAWRTTAQGVRMTAQSSSAALAETGR